MKYIVKDKEPESLSEWKKENGHVIDFDDYSFSKIKRDIRNALMSEQGYICCYCEDRIEENKNHIEHWRPQNDRNYASGRFDYNNMLLSCQCNLKKGETSHCGFKKDKWYNEELMVSPLERSCEKRFRFNKRGNIRPETECDLAASKTIEKLELDCYDLRKSREEAIEGISENIGGLSSEELRKLKEGFKKKDKHKHYQKFYTTILQVLCERIET